MHCFNSRCFAYCFYQSPTMLCIRSEQWWQVRRERPSSCSSVCALPIVRSQAADCDGRRSAPRRRSEHRRRLAKSKQRRHAQSSKTATAAWRKASVIGTVGTERAAMTSMAGERRCRRAAAWHGARTGDDDGLRSEWTTSTGTDLATRRASGGQAQSP
jgi:hypothetical protein